ncbi:MAG TPA: class I SAM-dependent methyltransferase [Candidatus Limnocylindria bacterium]
MDLGTGDGRFVLAHAAAHPERLVLGVDANADGMTEASRRAAQPAGRGGQPNARFVVAALEALPAELDGLADRVTVHFPWGSLRAAAAGHDPTATARLVRLLQPGGVLELLLADGERDAAQPVDPDTVTGAFTDLGLRVTELAPATFADAAAVHSSWGKRLLRNPTAGRTAWRIRLVASAAESNGHG